MGAFSEEDMGTMMGGAVAYASAPASFGVPKVKAVTGNKILRILKLQGARLIGNLFRDPSKLSRHR